MLTSRYSRHYGAEFDIAEGVAIVTKKGCRYFTDSRYIESAEKNLKGFEVLDVNREIITFGIPTVLFDIIFIIGDFCVVFNELVEVILSKDLPRLNEAYLEGRGREERDKAERLFDLLQLDHFPLTPKDKDRRYRSRNEARNCALENKKTLEKLKDSSLRKAFLKQTEQLALATGFFSVWMEVFKDDKEVRQMLISSFKGTKKEYCKDFK